jgi:vesicular inhibitory amino acid transporter
MERSPLDEPLLAEEKRGGDGDGDNDIASSPLLLQQSTGASFSRSCLNLSNVISGMRPEPINLVNWFAHESQTD